MNSFLLLFLLFFCLFLLLLFFLFFLFFLPVLLLVFLILLFLLLHSTDHIKGWRACLKRRILRIYLNTYTRTTLPITWENWSSKLPNVQTFKLPNFPNKQIQTSKLPNSQTLLRKEKPNFCPNFIPNFQTSKLWKALVLLQSGGRGGPWNSDRNTGLGTEHSRPATLLTLPCTMYHISYIIYHHMSYIIQWVRG